MAKRSVYPFFAAGSLLSNTVIYTDKMNSKNDVHKLDIAINDSRAHKAVPGQFFMLRRANSKHILGRPISVYRSSNESGIIIYSFLIVEKGGGTKELINLNDERIELLGPLGNGFPMPDHNDNVCLVGGGIGIAPIINLANAKELIGLNVDLYGCFKDGSYGLPKTERLFRNTSNKPLSCDKVIIATETGREGRKGMLNAILTPEVIKDNGYTIVYACGPTPMLKYVQDICRSAGVKCWLSLENYMACGMGACLGCSIETHNGNKRCCIDGPVFDGESIVFKEPKTSNVFIAKEKEKNMFDFDFRISAGSSLKVDIAGVTFQNPVIAASGTFGYGAEYDYVTVVNRLGGICSKGLTVEARPGNPGVRVYEVPGGMMNSIGLENPGIEHFIDIELLRMLSLSPTVVIANLSGSSIEQYVEGAKMLNKTAVPMIELNISCPNVKTGGMAFGMDPHSANEVTAAVRAITDKPLIVKLTPNAPDLLKVAEAVCGGGANALSLVNTFQALAIDIKTGRPVFDNTFAGLSGPGIKPIALRMVYQVASRLSVLPKYRDIPIIGIGGITTWQDAVEFIMAGASAVEVGTATFNNPNAMLEIISGLKSFMKSNHLESIEDIRGTAL